ncbi:hypothetical protein JDV02_009177 [Purpureocillium takamizusanense]|uniref:Uncharacterized protein n=1 Tax=Purpureocillium takamizusanense TaxID=2060973 RepID=A0A9Q8QQB4_9HYPO|nr:uncharacterized protein JDV02_009177 [Purpureocillium takamizusanense]UNI23351.1 hypothetical protein JDV02_009177 [Purpureocillium takamizusanense]
MLPRAAAAFGRASNALIPATRQRLAARPHRIVRRNISLLPWRRNKVQEPLPVYFSRIPSQSRTGVWRSRLGRVAFTTFALYACWQIFATVVIDPLLDWADHEWEALSEKEKQEMEEFTEEDEPILFLPFPFTTKEVQQLPYKGSDPEWAMFVAVNKDKQLQKDIKLGLAEIIRRSVEHNPPYVKLLGGDIKLKKMWLDIIYPPGPPPRHYISGVVVDEDGIYWGDRPIDSLAATHLNMAIYPKAVAMTVWTFVNFLFKQTAQDVAKALGLGSSPHEETSWQSVTLDRWREQGWGEQGAFGGPGKQPASASAQQPEKQPAGFPIQTAGGNILGVPLSGESQMDPRIQAALQAASMTFSRHWQPAMQPPTRGCIVVDGIIELQGKTAVMAVFVLGWYDPKQRRFVGIHTGLKHLVQLKQRPAGG